jgi:multicomponent K+:H+ antiporter subunit G
VTLSIAAEIAVAVLLLGSGVLVLTAALGLSRLADFFQRMHAPSLATTLAAWCVTLASILHFSVLEERLSLHVVVINVLLAITAPVTTVLLARAALFRRRLAGDALPPPLGSDDSRSTAGGLTSPGTADRGAATEDT